MSDIRIERMKRAGKGRFADRAHHHVPKSKSLQTLETNLDDDEDDVFNMAATDDAGMKRVPSVHELRVTKSLSKLNVPAWFKNSPLSKSGSCILRRDSTSTMNSFTFSPSLTSSPCPSLSSPSTSNAVVIKTRVQPPSSARLLRMPPKPAVPPSSAPGQQNGSGDGRAVRLPSDKYRNKEPPKGLAPVPVVPFAKIRAMFEAKAKESSDSAAAASSTITSSTTTSTTMMAHPPSSSLSSREAMKGRLPHSQEGARDRVDGGGGGQVGEGGSSGAPLLKLESGGAVQNGVTPTPVPTVSVTGPPEPHPSSPRRVGSPGLGGLEPIRETPTMRVRESLPLQQQHATSEPSSPESPPSSSPDTSRPQSSGGGGSSGTAAAGDFVTLLRQGGELPSSDHYSYPLLSLSHHHSSSSSTTTNKHSAALQHSSHTSYSSGGHDEVKVVLNDVTIEESPRRCLGSGRGGGEEASVEEVLEGLLAFGRQQAALAEFRSQQEAARKRLSLDLALLDAADTTSTPRQDPGGRDEGPGPPTTPDCHPHPRSLCSPQEPGQWRTPAAALELPGWDDSAPVSCAYPPCGLTLPLGEARQQGFKTCHSCYTYYCGRACRRLHWEEHKRVCHLSQVNSACKHVIKRINGDPQLQYRFSRLARRGYLTQGRGCVLLGLRHLAAAQSFLQRGLAAPLHLPPLFVSLKELRRSTMFGDVLPHLIQVCSDYNPELKYVLHVGVGVGRPISGSGWDDVISGEAAPSPVMAELPCPSPNGGGSVFGYDESEAGSPGVGGGPQVASPRSPDPPGWGGGSQSGRTGGGDSSNSSSGRDGEKMPTSSSSSLRSQPAWARAPGGGGGGGGGGGLLRRHASCRECGGGGRDSASRQNGRVSFAPGTRGGCPGDSTPPSLARSHSCSSPPSSSSSSRRTRGSGRVDSGSSAGVFGRDPTNSQLSASCGSMKSLGCREDSRGCLGNDDDGDRRGSGGFEFSRNSSSSGGGGGPDLLSPRARGRGGQDSSSSSSTLAIPRSVSAEAGLHGNNEEDADNGRQRRSSSGYGSVRHSSSCSQSHGQPGSRLHSASSCYSSDRLDSVDSAGSLRGSMRGTAPAAPLPRKSGPILQKCAKLRLSPAHMHPASPGEEHSTLILTASPGAGGGGEGEEGARRAREVSFINIQRKLRERGVVLRHQFPDVYSRLIDFVAEGRHFPPEILYPPDARNGGRPFMCVIMPESQPHIEWLAGPPDLLQHELDLSAEDLVTPRC